jgi:pimeloyl-ACP methyl ester carboxylesterase
MLAFEEAGTGEPPLVLIHGWICDRQAMAPVAHAFSSRHRCISVDLLGHGESPHDGDVSISAQAQAVLDVMPDQAILIGHSMGGQIALEAAALAPARVKAIVLLDAAQIIPHEGARSFAQGLRDKLAHGNVSEIVGAFARRQFVRATEPETAESIARIMERTDPETARAAWSAIIEWNGAAAMEKLSCPTLLITADKSANIAADVASQSKQVMTAHVAGSGHMLQFEVMDQIKPMIDRWMQLKF